MHFHYENVNRLYCQKTNSLVRRFVDNVDKSVDKCVIISR